MALVICYDTLINSTLGAGAIYGAAKCCCRRKWLRAFLPFHRVFLRENAPHKLCPTFILYVNSTGASAFRMTDYAAFPFPTSRDQQWDKLSEKVIKAHHYILNLLEL